MFMQCEKCKKDVEPKVLMDTLKEKTTVTDETKAICPECMNVFNMNPYTLKMLVNLKQLYTRPKAEGAFAFNCDKCNKCVPAKLSSDKSKALCGNCDQDLNLTSYAVKAMHMLGK